MAEPMARREAGNGGRRPPAHFAGEMEFRRLLDTIPAAAYICDPEGLITYYNDHAVRLWGREPKRHHPEDRFCGSFRLWWPDGSPMAHHQCWMAQALQNDKEFNGCEVVIERADGRRLTALAHANPTHDAAGRLTGAVNVLIDISERKSEEQDLKRADRAKDEFLATLAHELRNPLAPICNALQLMKRAEGDGAAVAAAREIIERQVSQMVRLVDDLLDIGRITCNKLELRRETVELSAAIGDAVEATRPLIEELGHRLKVSLPDAPVVLEADPVRLAQVFHNLLDNAAKYGRAGGGEIALTAERRGDEVVVAVRDDGAGIPAELQAKVFELFAQAERSLDRTHSGLGIGLTLVRRLVEMHGGTIAVASDGPGRGSEFVVRLPAGAAAPRQPAAEGGGMEATTRRRVLVVDDNRDSATSLAAVLRLTGDETHAVFSGEEALARGAELHPEVVLLDLAMPGLNGYETARRIRAEPWGRDATLVAISGWGQEEDVRRSRRAGIDHHLVKPLDLAKLRELLR